MTRYTSLRFLVATAALIVFVGVGCSSNKKSDRDARIEQIRNNAETKRLELTPVVGEYFGLLRQGDSAGQSVTLSVEIKDIPSQDNGEVDPVMIPTLSGYLRFNYGGSISGSDEEFIGFGITKGEFNPKAEKLTLVVENAEFKSIVLDLSLQGNKLTGSWAASALSESGELSLSKSTNSGGSALIGDYPIYEMQGEYRGLLKWNKVRKFQYASMTLNTALVPPDNFQLSATIRLYFGGWNSTEFLTYSFSQVEFNPITGQMSIRDDASEISFSGKLVEGNLVGKWFTNYPGKTGSANFSRNKLEIDGPKGWDLYEPFHGTYFGEITDSHPEFNFPERVLLNFVSGEDRSKPRGISVTGRIRFYIGPFDSSDFVEIQFSTVEFNFFTRKLIAKTSGDYNLTIKADVRTETLDGELYDAPGKVGTINTLKGVPSSVE